MLGRQQKGKVEEFLELWSLKEKAQEYRNLLAHRQTNALEIEAAIWFAHQMDLTQTELQEDDVEAGAVIRTALLKRLLDDAGAPIENQIEFATLLDGLRKTYKLKAKRQSLMEIDQAWAFVQREELPAKFAQISRLVLEEIITRDLSLVFDPKLTLDRLVFELKERYFICAHEMEDTSDYDALVSKEWSKLTKGKTDIDSLLTLFLCIAVDVPAKTSVPEKTAKSLIKKIREHGLDAERVVAWIKSVAPHEKQEGLLEDWRDFAEEAQVY
ncbi:MAG: hypothetical protein HYR92_00375 [Burkholderiales bacterium]|nr:hypothetical protein [Burkholderiales bacterium]